MHSGVECSAGIIDRIALIGSEIEIESSAETIVGLIDRGIVNRLAALLPNQLPRQLL
jgi:hypothetical protein